VTGDYGSADGFEALARAVRMLLENDEMRAKYGRAAAARAEEAFTVERMGKNVLRVYEASRRNFPHYCTSKNGNGFLTKADCHQPKGSRQLSLSFPIAIGTNTHGL